MLAASLDVRDLRSLPRLQLDLGSGITSVVGGNGAGKTSLLEALYFGLTGRSFRTGDRRELLRFGQQVARAEIGVSVDERTVHSLLASVSRSEGRRHLLDGEPVSPEVVARHRPHIIVFSPDRLALIKGPPAERRAHLDGFIGARWPSRSDLRQEYGRSLAQRNALLRRVAASLSPRSELDAWDSALVASAAPLIAARAEAVAELGSAFAEEAAQLGLGVAQLSYAPATGLDPVALGAELADRRDSDLQQGRTSVGPHLDELQLTVDGRSLRRYGSQGEQRAGLLAFLFAEREVLIATGSAPPLMLLDDVMSELDPPHRELLATRLDVAGQTLVSAADERALPEAAKARLVRMPSGAAGTLRAVA